MVSRRAEIVAHDVELQEWLESMESLLRRRARPGQSDFSRGAGTISPTKTSSSTDATLNTPYRNTIPLEQQPAYPGDIELEARIENILRWNAMAMVLRAYDSGTGVGGHIGTYARPRR